jgi:hypothetical protein
MTNIDESMGWGLRAAEYLIKNGTNSGWPQAIKDKLIKAGGDIC